MSILSHLFLNYFILPDFYFIPILLDRENGTTILIVFYSYFKPLNKVVYFISIFSKQVKKKSKTGYFNPIFLSYVIKIVVK